MRREDLIRLCQAVPFRPFRIYLSNGERFDIRHPELIATTLGVAHISFPEQDNGQKGSEEIVSIIVSLVHIVKIERLPYQQSLPNAPHNTEV